MEMTNISIRLDAGDGLQSAIICASLAQKAQKLIDQAGESVASVMLAEAKKIGHALPIKPDEPKFRGIFASAWEQSCRVHELFIRSAEAGEAQTTEALPSQWAANKSLILNGIIDGCEVLGAKDVNAIRKQRNILKETAKERELANGLADLQQLEKERENNPTPHPMKEYDLPDSVSNLLMEATKLLAQVPESEALKVLGGEDGSQGIIGRLSHIIVQCSLNKGKEQQLGIAA